MRSIVLLMIETEQPEGLSARKLVIETAKHNVLTAYGSADGLELLRRFPNVDFVLVHGLLPDCQQIIEDVLRLRSEMGIIVATPLPGQHYPGAWHVVPSHEPTALLSLLAEQYGMSLKN